MNDSSWEKFKRAFPLGSVVCGVVTQRRNHGFFVALPLEQRGHVDIINYRDDFKVNDESDFPMVGSGCTALIVGFSEQHKQVGLDMRPFQNDTGRDSVDVEIGLRTNALSNLEYFGVPIVNAYLQRGWKIASVREGNAFFEKIAETDDSSGLALTGGSLIITFSTEE